jgi:large subunit ribosomal protein L6
MSRIGKQPITIPEKVKVSVQGNHVTVEGPRGKLERDTHENITLQVVDSSVLVTRPDDSKTNRALHGLTRSLVANMVEGVVDGFEKELKIEGVGYRAALKGNVLNLSLGYSHPVDFNIPEGVKIEVGNQVELKISGIDKEQVGQTAANIRFLRPPEPYRGKGIRYSDEHVRRKAGKQAASAK